MRYKWLIIQNYWNTEHHKRCVMTVNTKGKNIAWHSDTTHNSKQGTLNSTEILKSPITKFYNTLYSRIQKNKDSGNATLWNQLEKKQLKTVPKISKSSFSYIIICNQKKVLEFFLMHAFWKLSLSSTLSTWLVANEAFGVDLAYCQKYVSKLLVFSACF